MSTAGRNAPCHCGSGRKYKHCCLQRPALTAGIARQSPTNVIGSPSYQDAWALYRRGLPSDAESICQSILWHSPRHIDALLLAARIAREGGRLPEAADLLIRATAEAPHDAAAHSELGLLQLELGRAQDAVCTLQRAVELVPQSPSAYNNLAVALLALWRVDEAEATCRRMLQFSPCHPPAYVTLAECQRRQGLPEEARRSLESALQFTPNSEEALVALADLQIATGEFEAAVERYRRAIAVSARPARIYGKLGSALKEMGDSTRALEALQIAAAREPNSPEPYCLLAQALLEYGRIPEAIANVQQAIHLKRDYLSAHILHAAALALLGEVDTGAEALREGLRNSKSRGECLTLMANHLAGVGYSQQAAQCLAKRLELEPEEAATRHGLAALTGLNPEFAPPEFVRQLFDGYAEDFEGSLLRGLAYSVPRELSHALLSTSASRGPWDILDLGCGTGLVGLEIAAHARSLVGVDLSAKMIERNRQRRLYTRLVCADLLDALAAEAPASFDVVAAADVFIYVGKLDAVVPAVRRVLRPGGLFAFSVEAIEEGMGAEANVESTGYWLHAGARYAHRSDYLTQLAALNGFAVRDVRQTRIRFESRRPVRGWLSIWCAEDDQVCDARGSR